MSLIINKKSSQNPQSGFTLIEVLVALVIISVGLLGVASLQVQGLRNNQSAYLRSQATLLAYDLADRMRTNSAAAIAGRYDGFDTDASSPSNPDCISKDNGCDPTDLALTDRFEWAQRVTSSGGGIALLPEARGRVIRGQDNLFTIEVSWQEIQWDDNTQEKAVSDQTFAVNFSL